MDFEKSYNYDDVFLRSATVSLISQLHNRLRWYNTFEDKKVLVSIPFQYSLVGDERYLMDAFMDDTYGTRPELNIEQLQRAIILLTEAEMFKCEQAIWNTLYPYKYFNFEWNYYRIDCTMSIPDSVSAEIPREIQGFSGEDKKTIKLSIDVNTFYPIEPVQAPISSSRKKVEFRGSMWELRKQNRERKWLGGTSFD